MFELIKELCELNGVSGREEDVAEYISARAEKYADTVYTDALGNVIAFKKGAKSPSKPLMLAAHMDEVGFMVSYVTDDGMLKLINVGGLYGQSLTGRTLYLPRTGLHGVLGAKPIHRKKPDERERVPQLDELYLDIGALSKKEAEEHVKLGDVAVFDTELTRFGDDMIFGKAIDDRLGCALLLKLMETELPVDVHFAFTVQEEVGLRGASAASFAVRPGMAIVVDCAGAADNAGFSGADRIAVSGKGPIISFADHATLYDHKLFDAVCDIADKNGVAWQSKMRLSGGTDAGSIHKSADGCRVIGISCAGRNIHTAASAVSMKDAEDCYKLIELTLDYLKDVE